MDFGALFIRAVKSGCIVSIFYHIGMMFTGQAVTVKQVAIFTVVFIGLYYMWLVMVTMGAGKRKK